MTTERWRRIEEVYHAARERQLETRAAFLEAACGGDDDLRREVESLLAQDSSGRFLNPPPAGTTEEPASGKARLASGSMAGPYRIVEQLGAGGMGEVFRATDTRLGRDVALKVLPADQLADPERRQRFLTEARTASALNHPHIVTFYDLLSEGKEDMLVLEYVPGRTLAQVIAERGEQRGLRLPDALTYAIQIADAMAAAHQAGIVHRDLKPTNVMVSHNGTIKVLDFGLAKYTRTEPDAERTQTMQTAEGKIVGTVAYMSPEQADGRKVDARSDIFSFGLVLYEMLTGRKAFLRDTTSSTLAAILRDEIEPVTGIPETLGAVLTRCLRKDPAKRAQTMADVKVSLEEVRDENQRTPAVPRRANSRLKWAAIAGVALFAVGGGLVMRRSRSNDAPFVVTPLTSYPGIVDFPTFSPDGSQVAFSWNGEKQNNTDIYVKLVDAAAPLRLTTNPAVDSMPAWSPDGRQVAFLRNSSPTTRELLLISPLGGVERKLVDLKQGVNPASWWSPPAWTPDSKFLAVRDETALVLVSVESGEKRPFTFPPAGLTGDWQAAISPDGQMLAFARIRNGPTQDVFVAPFSAPAKARQLTHVSRRIGGLAWTPNSQEIVFSTRGLGEETLWRIPAAGGTPERVPAAGPNSDEPAIALQGRRAAFRRRSTSSSLWRLDLSPQGVRRPPVQLATSFRSGFGPAISPDGQHIAFTSDRSGTSEIWVCDGQGAHDFQLTKMGFGRNPYWSPDGKNIVFEGRPGERNLVFVIAAGGGTPRQLASEDAYYPSWSRDGRWIYFYSRNSGAIETWKVPAQGGAATQITKGGGGPGIESVDGAYFYYHKGQEIWKVPVNGGKETLVTTEKTNFMNMWALGKEGLYFVEPRQAEHQTILKLLRLDSGQSGQVTVLEQPVPMLNMRLSLTADERSLLYSQLDRDESDIMLIENFR